MTDFYQHGGIGARLQNQTQILGKKENEDGSDLWKGPAKRRIAVSRRIWPNRPQNTSGALWRLCKDGDQRWLWPTCWASTWLGPPGPPASSTAWWRDSRLLKRIFIKFACLFSLSGSFILDIEMCDHALTEKYQQGRRRHHCSQQGVENLRQRQSKPESRRQPFQVFRYAKVIFIFTGTTLKS